MKQNDNVVKMDGNKKEMPNIQLENELAVVKSFIPLIKESIVLYAPLYMSAFNELKKNGFNDEQAMSIILNRGPSLPL